MSAIYACATVIFAPQMPANTLDAMIIQSAVAPSKRVARANQAYATTDPAMLTSSTGRRPRRSDSCPHHGAKRNCIAEKEAISKPSSNPLA